LPVNMLWVTNMSLLTSWTSFISPFQAPKHPPSFPCTHRYLRFTAPDHTFSPQNVFQPLPISRCPRLQLTTHRNPYTFFFDPVATTHFFGFPCVGPHRNLPTPPSRGTGQSSLCRAFSSTITFRSQGHFLAIRQED